MRASAFKKTRALLATVIALAGLTVGGTTASAAPVAINLCASTGSITMPDSVVVPVWGFVQTASCCLGPRQQRELPGPRSRR